MRAFVLALCLVATPAAAADQFDLVCTAPDTSERYRIDLPRGEWCFGKCERVMKLAEVTSGMITLIDEKPTQPSNVTAYNRINRATGAWEWYNYSPRLSSHIMDIKGHCEAAPFTGLPKPKF